MDQQKKGPDFLVVGTQKSGTYWVTALLNSHPDISCFPSLYGGQSGVNEAHFFDGVSNLICGDNEEFRRVFLGSHGGFFADLVSLMGSMTNNELLQLFCHRYIEFCETQRKGKRFLGEKTTEYVFCLDLIDKFFPDIKKLCILRDPRDRIVSFHFHQLRKKQKTEENITDDYIRWYCLSRIKVEYLSLINYAGNIYCVDYESLSANTGEVLLGLLNYLGVRSSADMIKSMAEAASFRSLTAVDKLSAAGSRKQGCESRESHYRKGIVGDWEAYLSNHQVEIIEECIGDLQGKILCRLGVNG